MLVMFALIGEFAMLTEVDIFLLGILGGAISSAAIVVVMYSHFKLTFKDYFYNKDHYVNAVTIKKLFGEVNSLKEQITQINLDHYEKMVKEEYK